MDGLGGTLKRKVFNAVKSGKVVVNDPAEFAMAAVNIVSGVHTIYLKESDLLMEPEEINNNKYQYICIFHSTSPLK